MESFFDGRVELRPGDCREVLKGIPDNSIDACVTDPPYALVSIGKRFGKDGSAPAQFGKDGAYARASSGFMGKQWDTGETAFAVEFWAEVLRVLKPGGYLIAFSGTRTYHRMAVAIEDSGFDMRDMILWHYGSGFPKSLDISKALDKYLGAERAVVGKTIAPRKAMDANPDVAKYGYKTGEIDLTAPATPEGEQWSGFGTALKPATEPICLARKPLDGTNAENVLKWGVGGLNIDGCRIGTDGGMGKVSEQLENKQSEAGWGTKKFTVDDTVRGRFPANLIHDGSEEVLAAFPDAGGGKASGYNWDDSGNDNPTHIAHNIKSGVHFGDSGSAARFFQSAPYSDEDWAWRIYYTAKAGADDRLGVKHPTVKPVGLIQYLERLVCPPGGTIMDPFAGTGTAGEAALREGFRAILIEREADYQADIRHRMSLALASTKSRKKAATKKKPSETEIGGMFE